MKALIATVAALAVVVLAVVTFSRTAIPEVKNAAGATSQAASQTDAGSDSDDQEPPMITKDPTHRLPLPDKRSE